MPYQSVKRSHEQEEEGESRRALLLLTGADATDPCIRSRTKQRRYSQWQRQQKERQPQKNMQVNGKKMRCGMATDMEKAKITSKRGC